MTLTDTDDLPDDVLEDQAAAEGLGPRPTRRHRDIPHDADAETGVLGVMLYSTTAAEDIINTGLNPEHFWAPKHQAIYNAICLAIVAGEKPDAVTVPPRGDGSFTGHDLLPLIVDAPVPSNGPAYARRVIHCARLRTVYADATEAAQAAKAGDLPRAIAAVEHLVVDQPVSSAIRHQPLGAFIDSDEADHDWVIPGLLERTDRILLTGPEGGGKSTLLRQIGIQAAAGIHPFTHNDVPALRVLLLDLENSERQVRRALRPLRVTAGHVADDNLTVAVHPQGLDLTDPTDVGTLTHLIATVQPDLVVGGPIYKLVGGDPTEEQPAKAAAMVLDRLRVAHGFALALETHQPHDSGGKRPERPYGASLWKRWPEFGLHIAETGQLRHWRGARDEREWPAALTRGGEWPWTMELDSRKLSFAQIVKLTRQHGRRLSERELSMEMGVPKTSIHNALMANRRQYDDLCARLEEEF